MNRYERKAMRRIRKVEKYLRKTGKRCGRLMDYLCDVDYWEGDNDLLNIPYIAMNDILLALRENGYWEEDK